MPQNTTAGRQRAGGELWWQQNLPQHPQAPKRPAQIWHSSSAEPRCFWDTGTGKEGNEESLFNGGIRGDTAPVPLGALWSNPPHLTGTAATSVRVGQWQELGKGCKNPPPAPRDEAGDPLGEDTTFQLSPGVLQSPFPLRPHLPVPLLLPSGSSPALRKACQAVTCSLPLASVPG